MVKGNRVERVFVRYIDNGYEIDFRRGPVADFMNWQPISHRRLCKISMFFSRNGWVLVDTAFSVNGLVVLFSRPESA
jgi:hypothetical protein